MNAIAVSDGSHTFSTVGATTDGAPDAACQFFGDSQVGNDIWFCYTASCTGQAIFSLCGSDYDTKLVVYDGCGCPSAQAIACNDDGCGSDVTSVTSRVTLPVVAGHQYGIRVGGYIAAMGNGTLTIRCGNADSCIAGAGDCFTGHVENAPGCNDSTCCHETCGLDQFCCDVTWDDYCASEATGLCTGNFPSCGPTSGDCGSAQSGPGCNNSACCNEICRSDPFCCLVSWDFDCVGEANGTCFLTCTAQSGSCFLSHGGPGCNDANCCQKVCGPPNNDTFCCDTQWDAQCASEAQGSGCVATQCGDGVVQGGEQCDDGNANDNDACTNACTIARCGDGIVQTGVEECDDGNLNNNDACTNSCVLARCGDGIVQSGVEQCDDSNANDNDACTNSCRVARCGDGIVESGIEECDDGNLINTDGCTNSCTLPRCGDGILQAGEQCDGASSESCGGGPCLPNCTCQPVVQSIPTMSHWAIALVGLVLLIGAKLRFRANMDMPIR